MASEHYLPNFPSQGLVFKALSNSVTYWDHFPRQILRRYLDKSIISRSEPRPYSWNTNSLIPHPHSSTPYYIVLLNSSNINKTAKP